MKRSFFKRFSAIASSRARLKRKTYRELGDPLGTSVFQFFWNFYTFFWNFLKFFNFFDFFRIWLGSFCYTGVLFGGESNGGKIFWGHPPRYLGIFEIFLKFFQSEVSIRIICADFLYSGVLIGEKSNGGKIFWKFSARYIGFSNNFLKFLKFLQSEVSICFI